MPPKAWLTIPRIIIIKIYTIEKKTIGGGTRRWNCFDADWMSWCNGFTGIWGALTLAPSCNVISKDTIAPLQPPILLLLVSSPLERNAHPTRRIVLRILYLLSCLLSFIQTASLCLLKRDVVLPMLEVAPLSVVNPANSRFEVSSFNLAWN